MGLRINTNPASLKAQRLLQESSKALARSLQRLSSGKRVNQAADDASGLSIINGLRAQSSGLVRAVRNINDSLSLLAVADSGISTQMEIVQRMRELALQAANGTLSSEERGHINIEITELMSEFNRIVEQSSYTGINYLKDGLDNIELQVGPQAGDQLNLNLDSLRAQDVFTKDIGTGSFSSASTSFSSLVLEVEVGDFNGDGNLDTISGRSTADGNVYLHLGQGDGSFSAAITFSVGSRVDEFKVADINSDGKLDIVASSTPDDAISVLLGDGAGGFSAVQTYAAQNGGSLEIADLNSDGVLDVIVGDSITDNNGTGVSVLLGNGSGGFLDYDLVNLATAINVVKSMSDLSIGDFDGDGNQDVIFYGFAGAQGTGFGATGSFIALGDGQGGFGQASALSLGVSTTEIEIADIDGDGNLDAITGNGVAYGTGVGGFQNLTAFDGAATGSSVALDDINRDGHLDAVLSDGNVYFGDGAGNFTQKSQISVSDTTGDVKFGDFNSDGNVDIIGLHNVANTMGVQLSILETVSAVSDVHVRDAEGIQDLLGVLDTALDKLVTRRSQIGALQNRLESAKNVSLITQENFEAARSQIEDADMAEETAELVKWQVLQQASLSVLTQANTQIQVVLQLLN